MMSPEMQHHRMAAAKSPLVASPVKRAQAPTFIQRIRNAEGFIIARLEGRSRDVWRD